MREAYEHLRVCEGCDECTFLLSLYTACDNCGHWMNNECEHYYDQATGEALCWVCEPKDKPVDTREGE